MWPWKRQLTASEVPRSLVDRLERVEKTQEENDRAWRKLKLEWEDVYDRLERIVARINARSRKDRQPTETDVAPSGGIDVEAINTAIREGRYPAGPFNRR